VRRKRCDGEEQEVMKGRAKKGLEPQGKTRAVKRRGVRTPMPGSKKERRKIITSLGQKTKWEGSGGGKSY